MTNPLANRARQHIVGPISRACFLVWRNVRRDEPREIGVRPARAGAKASLDRQGTRSARIGFRMTTKTAHHGIDQILAAFQSGRGRLNVPVGQGARAWPNEQSPPNGQGYCDGKKD